MEKAEIWKAKGKTMDTNVGVWAQIVTKAHVDVSQNRRCQWNAEF